MKQVASTRPVHLSSQNTRTGPLHFCCSRSLSMSLFLSPDSSYHMSWRKTGKRWWMWGIQLLPLPRMGLGPWLSSDAKADFAVPAQCRHGPGISWPASFSLPCLPPSEGRTSHLHEGKIDIHMQEGKREEEVWSAWEVPEAGAFYACSEQLPTVTLLQWDPHWKGWGGQKAKAGRTPRRTWQGLCISQKHSLIIFQDMGHSSF